MIMQLMQLILKMTIKMIRETDTDKNYTEMEKHDFEKAFSLTSHGYQPITRQSDFE